MVLPGMSGPQLVEELAARGCDVPIVFVSGYGSEELASRGIGGARAAMIEKPFQSELLLAKVRELLDASDEAERPHRPERRPSARGSGHDRLRAPAGDVLRDAGRRPGERPQAAHRALPRVQDAVPARRPARPRRPRRLPALRLRRLDARRVAVARFIEEGRPAGSAARPRCKPRKGEAAGFQ